MNCEVPRLVWRHSTGIGRCGDEHPKAAIRLTINGNSARLRNAG
jgi:hypothetical protein